MTLWERELAAHEGKLETLSPASRLAVAVTALGSAYETEPVPVEDRGAARWIEDAIQAGRAAVSDGASKIVLPPDLDAEFEEIDEGVAERGVSQLLTAIIACVDSAAHGASLSADALSEVLFSCYVFTAQRQDPEPSTIEQEEANARCLEVIAYHKDLITQAAA